MVLQAAAMVVLGKILGAPPLTVVFSLVEVRADLAMVAMVLGG